MVSPHSDYTQCKRVAACCASHFFTLFHSTLCTKKHKSAASSDALALHVVALWGHHGYDHNFVPGLRVHTITGLSSTLLGMFSGRNARSRR